MDKQDKDALFYSVMGGIIGFVLALILVNIGLIPMW